MIVHTKGEYDDCLQDWRAWGRRSWWLTTTMGYSPQEEVWIMPKAATKIDDGLQWQEWWRHCKRVCVSWSSGQRKLKIACGKINGIVTRGRLDCAKGCDKKWKMVRDNEINSIVARGSKAHDCTAGKKGLRWKGCNRMRGWACSLMGHSNGMHQPR